MSTSPVTPPRRPFFSLVFFFTLVATTCDQVWVRLGVLEYPHAYLFGQAWWVPFLFAVVTLVVPTFAVATRILLPPSTPFPLDVGGSALISGAWFVSAFLAGGLFDGYSRELATVLAVIWLGRLWVASESFREGIVLAALSIATSLAGTVGESAASWLGLMHYPRPDFWGVPFWLPALWLHAALFARDLAREWFWGR